MAITTAQRTEDERARFRTALEAIVALDLGKTKHGRDDFYTGPDRFFRAYLIAYEALALGDPAQEPKP